MTTFAQFFHLRDLERTDINLRPEHDAQIFVDIDGILPKVRKQLRDGVPKLVIFGDIGTGKSHLLRHVEHVLARETRYQPVFITLSGFDKKSRFARVHALVMDAIEPLLSKLLELPTGVQGWIERDFQGSDDMREALRKLANPKLPLADRARVRAWLKGTGPSAAQGHKLGFSGRLSDHAGPAQLVNLWRSISEMYQKFSSNHAMLLLLFDEAESIQQTLSPEGQHDLGNGFRHLLDDDNRALGCMFGLNMPLARGVHPFLRADVFRRIDHSSIPLQPIGGVERTRQFVEGFWKEIAPGARPLLDASAIEFVGTQLARLRERLGIAKSEGLGRTPTQADLLVVLNEIAHHAFETNTRPPLSEASVRAWLRLEAA